MSDYLATADVWTVLDLIAAEFRSDPMSVQCFDLRLVKRATKVAEQWRSRGGTAWQPIETCPPTAGHGLHVLVYVPRHGYGSLIVEAWVNNAERGSPWVAQNGGQIEPTHWMPRPDSPAEP